MNRLPDEVLLHLFYFLEPLDLVNLQSTSRNLLKIGRDNGLWKRICFARTIAATKQQRAAETPIARAFAEVQRRNQSNEHNEVGPNSEMLTYQSDARRRINMMACWDPSYPEEQSNFYQEFIHRHAPVTVSWFQGVHHGKKDNKVHHEATGMGVLYDDAGRIADKLIAPMDDGSICVWDAAYAADRSPGKTQGHILHKTPVGLLAGLSSDLSKDARLARSKALMTETGAVEVVSIDNRQQKGYFGVQNVLTEVDLRTMQVVSRSNYPFAITAISEAKFPIPITVGTNNTIHLHDSRQRTDQASEGAISRCELIAGTPRQTGTTRITQGDFTSGHASLSQPGALSILHLPEERQWDGNGEIWIAGRFTSLLNYDRRFFPKIRGTVHSGARVSSLSLLPFPYVPTDFRNILRQPSPSAIREAKSIPGYTILAAGEYKSKGSLELYGLSSEPLRGIMSTDSRTTQNDYTSYRNRQTASRTKLLSVASHGSRIVFSDADGVLSWLERDGITPVRRFNINDAPHPLRQKAIADTSTTQGQPVAMDPSEEDIIQKIIPTVKTTTTGHEDVPLGQDNLLVWTGDGLLGMVGFGNKPDFSLTDLEEKAQTAFEAEQLKQEREHDMEMRRALERQAAELRWMRGYGLDV